MLTRADVERRIGIGFPSKPEITAVFQDRTSAGLQLVSRLADLEIINPLVVAIPNGGIPVALPIGAYYGVSPRVCFVAKIPFISDDQRFGVGAIDESGEVVLNTALIEDLEIDQKTVEQGIQIARRVLEQRQRQLSKFRLNGSDITGKTLVIVDDGLASGFTSLTAVRSLRRHNPQEIVLAAPVAGSNSHRLLEKEGVKMVSLVQPQPPFIVDHYYANFAN